MEKRAHGPAIAIDMGERHHLAIVSDCPDFRPILVPNAVGEKELLRLGRMARRSPQTFRREMAELTRYLEERCHEMVQTCLKWNIRSVAIGNRSIQNPYRVKNRSLRENPLLNLTLQIIHTMRFQCALSRIDTLLVDESFTSQVDALSLERIEDAGNRRSRKKRRKGYLRGKVYHSETGETLDRDINAAINIGRIVFGNRFAEDVLTYGTWKNPILLNWGTRDHRENFIQGEETGQTPLTTSLSASHTLGRTCAGVDSQLMREDLPPGLVSHMIH